MKKLTVKTGEYVNGQGETKGRYANIGVIMSNENGEFALIDPTVCLGGIFALQQAYNATQGKAPSDRIMAGIYEENTQQQGQQQAPQQNYQQAPQQHQGGYQAPQSQNYQNGGGYNPSHPGGPAYKGE